MPNKDQFLLDPEVTFLNHGSFGACSKEVYEDLLFWQRALELQPVKYFEKTIFEKLEDSRSALSNYVNCDKDDLVLVPNPSTAINTVAKSLQLCEGDEILATDHEYGAMDRTWQFVCNKTKSKYIQVPYDLPIVSKKEFINSFLSRINKNTKVIFISHITSPTGLIFPVREICDAVKNEKIITIIDGAHAPAHIDLNIKELCPDIYTGACHKWMCSPKGVSFLYVNKSLQKKIDPLIVSWGWNSDNPSHSLFLDYHQYQGTRDMGAFLTIPKAINFLKNNNWEEVSSNCKIQTKLAREKLIDALNSFSICSEEWIGQMCSVPINVKDIQSYRNILIEKYKIEIPIFKWRDKSLIRLSFQAYNSQDDVDKLIEAIKDIE